MVSGRKSRLNYFNRNCLIVFFRAVSHSVFVNRLELLRLDVALLVRR